MGELSNKFDASNFAITYARNGNSDLKVLTFDTPVANKPYFPKRMQLITHRGGMPKIHQPNGIPVYCETNREHWGKVLNQGISTLQRKNVLIPDASAPHSNVRCDQFPEHSSKSDTEQKTITIGLENAPFVFCPFACDKSLVVEDIATFLQKYALDKYRNTPMANFEQERISWYSDVELPRINLRSSKNWRIMIFQIKPAKEITVRQICKSGDKYKLIQGSAVKTLTFDKAII